MNQVFRQTISPRFDEIKRYTTEKNRSNLANKRYELTHSAMAAFMNHSSLSPKGAHFMPGGDDGHASPTGFGTGRPGVQVKSKGMTLQSDPRELPAQHFLSIPSNTADLASL